MLTRSKLVLGLLLGLATVPAAAFELVPISAEFAPTGANAAQTFRLVNPTDKPLAVELSIARRGMDTDGKDILEADEDAFVVYPTQVILQPQQVQTVRVQWIGAANPTAELAYRLIAEQVPLDLDEQTSEGGRLKLLVRYLASLYVRPAGVSPRVEVEASELVAPATPDPDRLRIGLVNSGSAHAILRDAVLVLTGADGASVELGPDALPGLAGHNILAGSRWELTLPRPPGLGTPPWRAELRYANP